MDPNATLATIQRKLSLIACANNAEDKSDVDAYVEYLRLWIARGGFDPDWARYPLGTSYYQTRMIQRDRDPRTYREEVAQALA